MKSWLFTWNPRKWAWDSPKYGYKEMIRDVEAVGVSYCKWSCGIAKSIQPGDRIFIMRIGKEPQGIMASGKVLTPVFQDTNWDEPKVKQVRPVNRVYIEIDKIVDPEKTILPADELISKFKDMDWFPQNSGISIPDDIAKAVEDIWEKIK